MAPQDKSERRAAIVRAAAAQTYEHVGEHGGAHEEHGNGDDRDRHRGGRHVVQPVGETQEVEDPRGDAEDEHPDHGHGGDLEGHDHAFDVPVVHRLSPASATIEA